MVGGLGIRLGMACINRLGGVILNQYGLTRCCDLCARRSFWAVFGSGPGDASAKLSWLPRESQDCNTGGGYIYAFSHVRYNATREPPRKVGCRMGRGQCVSLGTDCILRGGSIHCHARLGGRWRRMKAGRYGCLHSPMTKTAMIGGMDGWM